MWTRISEFYYATRTNVAFILGECSGHNQYILFRYLELQLSCVTDGVFWCIYPWCYDVIGQVDDKEYDDEVDVIDDEDNRGKID